MCLRKILTQPNLLSEQSNFKGLGGNIELAVRKKTLRSTWYSKDSPTSSHRVDSVISGRNPPILSYYYVIIHQQRGGGEWDAASNFFVLCLFPLQNNTTKIGAIIRVVLYYCYIRGFTRKPLLNLIILPHLTASFPPRFFCCYKSPELLLRTMEIGLKMEE